MSTALYRRYRPDTFTELVGQDHVVAPLMAALRGGKVTHAYLFSGPRGCGKTTSARIMARCLNCQEGPTDTPCGKCPSCCDLATGSSGSLDVVEIDAASHNGVDDARELRERATFAPVRDRYKIFILDEAHMVTPQGFNALLKLVEEPPEHVKFIFATTEPDKVISTIRSRTHHYPFRLVPPDILVKYLQAICERESILAGSGVLPLVVRAGGGSVRDSLSVLDQLMAGTEHQELDYRQCVALLGYTDATLLDDTVDALAGKDAAAVFAIIKRMVDSGHDPRRFVEDLLQRLRDLVIVSLAGREAAAAALHGTPDDQLERMYVQAQAWGGHELSQAADATHEALNSMQGATSPRLQVELLAARLLLIGAGQASQGQASAGHAGVGQASAGGAAYGAPLPHDTSVATTAASSESAPAAASSAPASLPADSSHPDNPQAIRQALAKKRAKREGAVEAAPSAVNTVNKDDSSVQTHTQSLNSHQTAPDNSKPVEQSSPPQEGAPDTVATQAQADTSAPPPGGSAQPGGEASQMIRHKWDDVLATLKNMSKAAWFRAQTCQVGPVEGSTLYAIFSGQGMANAFTLPDYLEALTKAIYEVVGLHVVIRPVTAEQVPVGSGSSTQDGPQDGSTLAGASTPYNAPVQEPSADATHSAEGGPDDYDAESFDARGSVVPDDMAAPDDTDQYNATGSPEDIATPHGMPDPHHAAQKNPSASTDSVPPTVAVVGPAREDAQTDESTPQDDSVSAGSLTSQSAFDSKDNSALNDNSVLQGSGIPEQHGALASESPRCDVDEEAQAFFRQFAHEQQGAHQSGAESSSMEETNGAQDNAHPNTAPPHSATVDRAQPAAAMPDGAQNVEATNAHTNSAPPSHGQPGSANQDNRSPKDTHEASSFTSDNTTQPNTASAFGDTASGVANVERPRTTIPQHPGQVPSSPPNQSPYSPPLGEYASTQEEQPDDDAIDEATFDDEVISDSDSDDTFIAAGVARIEEILGGTIIKETPLN